MQEPCTPFASLTITGRSYGGPIACIGHAVSRVTAEEKCLLPEDKAQAMEIHGNLWSCEELASQITFVVLRPELPFVFRSNRSRNIESCILGLDEIYLF